MWTSDMPRNTLNFRIRHFLVLCFLAISFYVITYMFATLWNKKVTEKLDVAAAPVRSVTIHPAFQATFNLGTTCDFVHKYELQQPHRAMGIGARPLKRSDRQTGAGEGTSNTTLFYTRDDWPQYPHRPFRQPIPRTPFDPPYSIQWDFNTTAFLKRPEVEGKPPKLITFVVPMGYMPPIPDPVRLRTCPEMPCRVTTNPKLSNISAALVWNVPLMKRSEPPKRTNPDQVFVFHNQERQDPSWIPPHFREEGWRSVFNWTMSYRFDSDILDVYGYLVKNPFRRIKDYFAIYAKKTRMIGTFNSHCKTSGLREKYIGMLQKHIPVHVYGRCGPYRCERDNDDECLKQMGTKYKFYLAFENSICPDYVTEKFFRFLSTDMVVVARGGKGYEKHAPPGTFINADDFNSIEELADYLVYLDLNRINYIKILLAKDCFLSMFEEYPHRHKETGHISFMHYHYEAVAVCEMCRRLWNLDSYRKTIPDIRDWYDKGNCLTPKDLH